MTTNSNAADLARAVANFSNIYGDEMQRAIKKGDIFYYPAGAMDVEDRRHHVFVRGDARSHFSYSIAGTLCRLPPKEIAKALPVQLVGVNEFNRANDFVGAKNLEINTISEGCIVSEAFCNPLFKDAKNISMLALQDPETLRPLIVYALDVSGRMDLIKLQSKLAGNIQEEIADDLNAQTPEERAFKERQMSRF